MHGARSPTPAPRLPWRYRFLVLALLTGLARPGGARAEPPAPVPAEVQALVQPLVWFDLRQMPGRVGDDLRRQRALSCGAPQLGGLPMRLPAGAQLLMIACHGGPPDCPGQPVVDANPYERMLGCPRRVDMAQLATAQLLLRGEPAEVAAALHAGLGEGFVLIPAGEAQDAVILERPDADLRRSWSPRRLTLQVAASGGVLRAAGHGTLLRLRLNLEPPAGPQQARPCDPTVLIRGGLAERSSRIERILGRDDPRCAGGRVEPLLQPRP